MPSLPGVERLVYAREILDQSGQQTAGASLLVKAALECWSGIIDSAAWPVSLRMEAMMLQRNMYRHGSIKTTINQMTTAEHAQLARDIIHLATAVERACSH